MSFPILGISLFLSLQMSLSLLGCMSILGAMLLTVTMLHATKRNENTIREKYPFQTTIEMGLNLYRMLDYMHELFQIAEKNNQKSTFSMNIFVRLHKLNLPKFVKIYSLGNASGNSNK